MWTAVLCASSRSWRTGSWRRPFEIKILKQEMCWFRMSTASMCNFWGPVSATPLSKSVGKSLSPSNSNRHPLSSGTFCAAGTSETSNACASENTSVLRQPKRTCFYIIWLFFSPSVITSFQLNHTLLWFNNWNSHFSTDILQAPLQPFCQLPRLKGEDIKWSLRGPDKPHRCAQWSVLLLESCPG